MAVINRVKVALLYEGGDSAMIELDEAQVSFSDGKMTVTGVVDGITKNHSTPLLKEESHAHHKEIKEASSASTSEDHGAT